MIDPLKLAQVCQAIYGDENPAGITFDQLWDVRGTIAGHTTIDGASVIAFRGSKLLGDWLDDAMVLPFRDPRLGWVHAGFFDGVSEIMDQVVLAPGVNFKTLIVTGHSLGGARARLAAGLCAHAGTPVECCVFGSPKPSYGGNLRALLDKAGKEHRSYANLNDDVPLYPPAPWWSHTDDAVALESHAPAEDRGSFRNHHMVRYLDGLQKIAALAVAA